MLSGHSMQECPLIHFNADKERIIKQYQWDDTQPRKSYTRSSSRERNQYRALIDQWAIQEISQAFQTSDDGIIKFYDEHYKLTQKDENVIHLFEPPVKESTPLDSARRMHALDDDVESVKKSSFHTQASAQLLPIPKKNRSESIKKKNGSRLQMKERQRIIQRFQAVVRKVIRLVKYSPRQKQTTALPPSSLLVKERENRKKFDRHLTQQVSLMYGQPINHLRQWLRPTEFEDCQLLRFNYLNEEDQFDFEQKRSYLTYCVNHNIEHVLNDFEKNSPALHPKLKVWFNQKPHSRTAQARRNILRHSLIHYLFYPFQYFNQFICDEPLREEKIETPKMKNPRELFQTLRNASTRDRLNQISLKMKRSSSPKKSRVEPSEEEFHMEL